MGRADPAKVRAVERRRDALALRRSGATYQQIGERLGVAVSTAHTAVQNALAGVADESDGAARELRALELERLDELQRSVWPEATRGGLAAIDRALKIMERRARLLGLDAPARQSLETGHDVPAIQVYIPDNGRGPVADNGYVDPPGALDGETVP